MTVKDSFTTKLTALTSVAVHDRGNGLAEVRLQAHELTAGLATELAQALRELDSLHDVKALLVTGSDEHFLSGGRGAVNAACDAGLWQVLSDIKSPLLLAARGSFMGAGCLFAAAADVLLLSESGTYGWTETEAELFPTDQEEAVLIARYGRQKTERLLYDMRLRTGTFLKAQGWNAHILPADQVEARAVSLANTLLSKSRLSLNLLKGHLASPVAEALAALRPVEAMDTYSLASRTPKSLKTPGRQIRVAAHSDRLELIVTTEKSGYRAAQMVKDIDTLLRRLAQRFEKQTLRFKTVLLHSEYAEFFPTAISADEVRQFQQALELSPVPVVIALPGNIAPLAWLAILAADAVVYAEDGHYSAAQLLEGELAPLAGQMFMSQFGQFGKELLAGGQQTTGAELAHRAQARSVPADDVVNEATQLVERWSLFSFDRLNDWKRQRVNNFRSAVETLPSWSAVQESGGVLPDAVCKLELNSEVIRAALHPQGFLMVRMEDREAKNLFSDAFNQGMNEVFERVNASDTIRAVILTGYDNYFASGGTKESLLALQSGGSKFTDNRVYQLALSCKVPVIAAMQGHGLGGGQTLGLFADFVILSEESKYLSPYMAYGFTPGAGATLATPEKFGRELATETLLSAEEISGSELRDRGLRLPVLPRAAVEQAALQLATAICAYPRVTLEQFKQHSVQHLNDELEAIYQAELAMHEQTFVGQQDTLNQIESTFHVADSDTVKPQTDSVEPSPAPIQNLETEPSGNIDQASLTDSAPNLDEHQVQTLLAELLAAELHMRPADVDEDTQFVDLGLDSITGVTFIRKINEHFATDFEATRVYSYPTIAQLARHVAQEQSTAKPVSASTPSVQEPPRKPETTEGARPAAIKLQPATAAPSAPVPASEPSMAGEQFSEEEIKEQLKELLADELHMRREDVDEDAQFVDLGLDSITGVTFVKRINERFGSNIEATKVYAHPTVNQMAAFVAEQSVPTAVVESPEASPPVQSAMEPVRPRAAQSKADASIRIKPRRELQSLRKQKSPMSSQGTARDKSYQAEPIAIIGMSGRFAKAANIDEYWHNIASGVDCVEEVPTERWDMDAVYVDKMGVPGKTNCRFMGMLADHDRFDPAFFEISPKEALSMDPQQRLFLQTSWHTFEHAGYSRNAVSGSRTGVFVGCGQSDYHLLARELQTSALGFTGSDTSILAARVAYLLNLQGPCLTIETACSSSLVAIASACDSLVSGASDMALAGGVGVIVGPDLHIKTAQTAMLSPDGRCFTFDQRANGFVPGEGVGAVLLKRLSEAERDGDRIYGLIEGWGVNQDGKTNGITAPNPESQARLETQVYEQFGIDPASIQLIETHGTGTKLGDPIEVDALKQTFRRFTDRVDYCALGSIKSNIGHCFTAAGIASVIKVVQSIQHRQLPPTINFDTLNEHIRLNNSPFYVNTQLREWELQGGNKRQAAVSGFGFGGTNAHLVISEYRKTIAEQVASPVPVIGPVMVPLAAKTEERLNAYAEDLLEFVRRQSFALSDLAYTLQVGRQPMEYRLVLVVKTIEELQQKLTEFLSGKVKVGVFRGDVSSNKESLALLKQDPDMRDALIDRWLSQGKPEKLAEIWAKGLDINWNRLYPDRSPHRIAAPVYPFLKQRYWITDVSGHADSHDQQKSLVTRIHPLLHENVSNFEQQAYRTRLQGDEAFLAEGVLPALAGLEMARAAFLHACGLHASGSPGAQSLYFENIEWAPPLSVHAAIEIEIALLPVDRQRVDFELYTVGSESRVLCQGSARIDEVGIFDDISLDRARSQCATDANQILLDLSLPELAAGDSSAIALHPLILDRALALARQSNFNLLAAMENSAPRTMQRLRFAGASDKQMTVWIRPSAFSAALDLSCFDAEGNLCAHIEGLSCAAEAGAVPAVVATQETVVTEPVPVSTAAPSQRSAADIQKVLVATLAEALYLDAAQIKPDKPFVELGLDSIVGVEWVNALNKAFGCTLNATTVYDYPNIRAFADYLKDELASAAPSTPAPAPAPTPEVTAAVVTTAPAATTITAPMPPQRDVAEVRKILVNTLAKALYMDAAEIKVEKPFVELGLDSIVGVEWVNELNKQFAITLNATTVYDYPNIQAFADYLMTQLPSQDTAPAIVAVAQTATKVVPAAQDNTSVAQSEPARPSPARYGKVQVQQVLVNSLAKALYMDVTDIKLDKPFVELGLDSIVGVEWVNELNKHFGISLNATRVYDYSNILAFAEYLVNEELPQQDEVPTLPLNQAAAQQAAPVAPQVQRSEPHTELRPRRNNTGIGHRFQSRHLPESAQVADEKIAIIGMSGHYPDAANLEQFWDNLLAGKNSIKEVPKWRWDNDELYDPDPEREDKIYCKWMGMLDDIASFDPLFFRISPAEAKTMDPQHRLFLEECYRTIENAGYSGKTLSNTRTGVYLGIIGREYADTVARADIGNPDITGNNYAIAAGRVAYFLNLKGPAIAIDTACSSSLVAIHMGVQALQLGEIDLALAGGASVYLEPSTYLGMCQAGMLSKDGQCKTFDNEADGFVPGEGAGAVLLKRLSEAERDRDYIHGVILSSGLNQDGATNGITAPSMNSQIALEREIYRRGNIHPETISYVEAHGTGTRLGDPIELEALSSVFREQTNSRNFCGLGSVKSNLGHTSGAAGVASVHKVLLSMRHKTLAPTLNVKQENALFNFADSPFYIQRQAQAWSTAQNPTRRAAVSSFGFSGTNAHLVLEEYNQPVSETALNAPALIVLSARTREQLDQKARDLQAFLQRQQPEPNLASLSYTLLDGRDEMDFRMALVVDSVGELIARLGNPSTVEQGRVARDGDGVSLISQQAGVEHHVANLVRAGDLAAIAALWIQGLELSWSSLYGGIQPQRIPLPGYPFSRKKYWVDVEPATLALNKNGSAAPTAQMHPLLQSNISGLGQYSFSSIFRGDEDFLIKLASDDSDRILPVTAYLEMARAAVLRAAPAIAGKTLRLEQLIVGPALKVSADRQVNIVLLDGVNQQLDFEIYSLPIDGDGSTGEVIHFQGKVSIQEDLADSSLDLGATRRRLQAESLDQSEIAVALRAQGSTAPPSGYVIQAAQLGQQELLAELSLPVSLRSQAGRYGLHPLMLDQALNALALLSRGQNLAPAHHSLPMFIQEVRILADCAADMSLWACRSQGTAPVQLQQGKFHQACFDLLLCRNDGVVAVEIRGLGYACLARSTPANLPQATVSQTSLSQTKPAQIRPPIVPEVQRSSLPKAAPHYSQASLSAKPRTVLNTPDSLVVPATQVSSKPTLDLSTPQAGSTKSLVSLTSADTVRTTKASPLQKPSISLAKASS